LDHGEENNLAMPMPTVDSNDLVGRTFLMPPQEDGQRFHACSVRAIEDHEWNLAKDEDCIHFLCSINDDQFEKIMFYNDLLSSLEEDGETNTVWHFQCITGHQGPLWENGEIATEPLAIIAADDPVTCAIYAKR
jgi:hypothetical protein